jgi:hypothetical protein
VPTSPASAPRIRSPKNARRAADLSERGRRAIEASASSFAITRALVRESVRLCGRENAG